MASTETEHLRNGTPPDARGRKRKGRGRGGAEGTGAAAASASDATDGLPPAPGRPAGPAKPRHPVKVGGRRAARRIAGLAEVSDSLDSRRLLRRLARQVEAAPRNVQEIAFLENALGECLDEATGAAVERERWLFCEAATWGLAWLARTRRAGGSAGSLLERITTAARSAGPMLAAGDTLPARFVLTVARLFADIEACRCLEPAAVAALEGEIGRLVGSEGGIDRLGSAAMLERLVRWSAARDVGLATGTLPWNQETDARFGRSVACGLRLLGRQGRLLAGAGRLPAAFSDPLLTAAAESRRGRVRRTAEAVQRSGGRAGDGDNRRKMLARDLHDQEVGVAVLRSGWESQPIRVLVQYREAVPHLEIAVGDRLLVDGPWRLGVATEAGPLAVEGPWTLSCWESDRHATFLEITAPLSGGLQIDRQIVLLPRDRVVILSAAVTHRPAETPRQGDAAAPRAGNLRLESVLPLAASLEGEQAEETREVFVSDTKPRFMALPLSLPEWKAAGRGRFEVGADGLVLEHQAAATRCCAPVWIDLDPTRQGRPLTWRQLTVADTRLNLPPQQAVGFRIQAGLEQWLVYRTLDEPRNRTVLGCNVSCDFLVGRIGRTGAVERTIEIQ